MQTKRSLIVICLAISALTAACGEKSAGDTFTMKSTTPAVNDENCKPESIANIRNKEIQQKFASACLRRSPPTGEASGATNKSW